jgi:hypothetical protein
MKLRTSIQILSCLALLFTASSSFGAADTVNTDQYYTDPQATIHEVSRRGASEVVAELSNQERKWYYVMDKIATGEQAWLKVAVVLRPGSDAGSTEEIFEALGQALKTNPKEVLGLISKDFPLEYVCSWPVVGTPPCTTYELCLKEIEDRQKSVMSVSSRNLRDLCKRCLSSLENGKRQIAESYGIIQTNQ